jgi:DNA-3-methyladenine glycosylase
MARLDRSFFARKADTVASDLLGTVLIRRDGDSLRRGRIVETEAYLGAHDLACHASRRRTKRTEVMFGPPGHAYVYLIYGIYDMLNIVTGSEGEPAAVLIRALEPLENLARPSGPGRLTREMGITRAHYGLDLCAPASPIWLEAGKHPKRVGVGPRVGIDYALDWKDVPLRFWDASSPFVSKR